MRRRNRENLVLREREKKEVEESLVVEEGCC